MYSQWWDVQYSLLWCCTVHQSSLSRARVVVEPRSDREQHNAGPAELLNQQCERERERERDISYISHLQTGRTFHEVKTDQISQSRMNPRDLGQGSRWLWGALVVSLLLPGKSCATINKPPQIMKDLNQKMPLKVGSFNR